MERVSLADRDAGLSENGAVRRDLSEPLGTTDVAINYYQVEQDGQLPAGLHAHMDQEEVFVVIEGTAVFETYATDSSPVDVDGAGCGDSREVTVEAGEVIRFAPGEFQSGRNGGAGELRLLALGAPPGTSDIRIPIECPECGRGDLRLETDEAGVAFACPDCNAERTPEPCPDCGGGLAMALDDSGGPVAACGDCGATFADPPLRG